MITFRQSIRDTNGTQSVVWQQQMEKTYIKTYRIVHEDSPDRYQEMDYTKDFRTQFHLLQLIEDYNPQYIDPEYGKDPNWDDELYDEESLQFRHDEYPPTDDEEYPVVLDTKLSRALKELWQTNSEANYPENRGMAKARNTQDHKQSLRRECLLHVLVTKN